MLPSPRPDLGISRSIRLLGIAQGRLQVLMPQPLPNDRHTDPPLMSSVACVCCSWWSVQVTPAWVQ